MATVLGLEAGQGGGDAVQHAADVDVDHPVPFLDLHTVEARQRHQPGIADQHVDAAKFRFGCGNEGLDIGAVGDVERAEGDRAAGSIEFVGKRCQPVGAAGAQHQLRAACCQQPGRALANAAAGAGDRDDLVLDSHD